MSNSALVVFGNHTHHVDSAKRPSFDDLVVDAHDPPTNPLPIRTVSIRVSVAGVFAETEPARHRSDSLSDRNDGYGHTFVQFADVDPSPVS